MKADGGTAIGEHQRQEPVQREHPHRALECQPQGVLALLHRRHRVLQTRVVQLHHVRALGARLCLIGRPQLFGLAVAGSAVYGVMTTAFTNLLGGLADHDQRAVTLDHGTCLGEVEIRDRDNQ